MAKGKERRQARYRIYSTVAAALILGLATVALVVFRQVGESQLEERVYVSPPKTLQHLAKAQQRFRTQDLDGDGQPNFATSMAALEDAQCITSRLASGEVQGYAYAIEHGDLMGYAITATPLSPRPGLLGFYMDQTGVIRARDGARADADCEIYYHPVHGQLWASR